MKRNYFRVTATCWISVSLAMVLAACSPAPRYKLSAEAKTADMYWLFSQFNENYAPLQYKSDRYRFNFEEMKAQYLQDAKATKSNEEFYLLMHKFVAEFKDAHTGSFIMASGLPDRSKLAYLGFDGIRVGNNLVVKKLLPTISSNSRYPVKVGDVISKLDGVSLPEIVKNEFLPYRNLGSEQANLTYLIPKIFNRSSLAHRMPTSEYANVTVVRVGKEVDIRLPWVVKDLYTFAKEQEEATKTSAFAEDSDEDLKVTSLTPKALFELGLQVLNQEVKTDSSRLMKLARETGKFDFKDTFFFVDTAPTWSSKYLSKIMSDFGKKKEPTINEMKRERKIPDNVMFVTDSNTYPAYVSFEKVLDKKGKATGAIKTVGYVYLNTFSPDGDEKAVIGEFKRTLKSLAGAGVKDVIIDMIDNGGGSLSLGLKLAQAMTATRIVPPDIQFKVSESWTDSFENVAQDGPSDSEKEIARRMWKDLKSDRDGNNTLSRRYGMESLMPFELEPNTDIDKEFKYYLLVNEMCASMCDIFTAVLKDNNMGTVVGATPMGAGGNVVSHRDAPNSHLIVNQTESLIVRRDGRYIENNGVEPDVAMDVNATVNAKYEGVRQKALELIVKEQ